MNPKDADDSYINASEAFRKAIDDQIVDDILTQCAKDAILKSNKNGTDLPAWVVEFVGEKI